MQRPALEVSDIFRDHGPAWRQAQRGHLSLGQLKVMSAIERPTSPPAFDLIAPTRTPIALCQKRSPALHTDKL